MAEKQKIDRTVKRGNFSCDVLNTYETKAEFVEAFKGKLNVDIDDLWKEITKKRSALKKKAAPKPSTKKAKDSAKTEENS